MWYYYESSLGFPSLMYNIFFVISQENIDLFVIYFIINKILR